MSIASNNQIELEKAIEYANIVLACLGLELHEDIYRDVIIAFRPVIEAAKCSLELEKENKQLKDQYEIIQMRIVAQKEEMGNTIDTLNKDLTSLQSAAVEMADTLQDCKNIMIELNHQIAWFQKMTKAIGDPSLLKDAIGLMSFSFIDLSTTELCCDSKTNKALSNPLIQKLLQEKGTVRCTS